MNKRPLQLLKSSICYRFAMSANNMEQTPESTLASHEAYVIIRRNLAMSVDSPPCASASAIKVQSSTSDFSLS